jgi:activating signal cointegrator 1
MAKLTPTHDQTVLPIDSLAPPVRRYGGILLHSGGGHYATEDEVDAPDLRTAHRLLSSRCVGSRYVKEIHEQVDGAWKQVWKTGQPLPIDWRVLTLTAPWGSLVAAAESDDPLIGKRYETRSWQTSYRGTVLFHQAGGLAKYREAELERLIKQPPFLQTCRHLGYHRFSDLPRGAIVAVATLTNIFRTEEVRNSLSATERAFGNYEDRRFAWQLRDIVRLNPVIADVKGHQQLWTWTGAIPQLKGHPIYG